MIRPRLTEALNEAIKAKERRGGIHTEIDIGLFEGT